MPRFDPWNSSSTGHQVGDGARGPQGWREMRTVRLQSQFSSVGGGVRLAPPDHDDDPTLKSKSNSSVADMLRNPGSMFPSSSSSLPPSTTSATQPSNADKSSAPGQTKDMSEKKRRTLDGVVVYVNGSTHPLISDHRLKRLLVEHGAQTALHLGRRRVTHVVVGRPASRTSGSGGGLAGGKLDKEIKRVGGCAVKYVGVEW